LIEVLILFIRSLFGCVVDFVIVIGHVVLDALVKLKTVFSRVQVDVIVLDGFPESFNPDIVSCPSFAVHGDLNALLFQVLCP